MRVRLLIFAIIFLVALSLAWESPRTRETFQRAEAALVCYWADPGPPLPVPIPKDPESIVSLRDGPRNAPINFPISKALQKQSVNYKFQPRPNRSKMRQRTIPPVSPLPSDAPYEITTTPSIPEPTLGTLPIPPENPVTQHPIA